METFKLKSDYSGMNAGTLILRGADFVTLENADNAAESGWEYFDMTTEMESGDSRSYYNIPEDLLEPASPEEIEQVKTFLDNLYPPQ